MRTRGLCAYLSSRKLSALAVLAAGVMVGGSLASAKEYIVKIKSDAVSFRSVTDNKKISMLSRLMVDQHEQGSIVKVRLPKASVEATAEMLAEIYQDSRVEYVVENRKVHRLGNTNDPDVGKQWALDKVRAEEAWTLGTGNRSVIVAITDTGIDYNHADLAKNMWKNVKEIPGNSKDDDGNGYVDDIFGYDFAKGDADPKDETSAQNPGHGTHCAGITGAVGNNSVGVSGMTQNVSLMAVRFLDEKGGGDLMNAIKAIDYSTDNGANIISASWGAQMKESDAAPITEAIARAQAKGVIFIAAAANDGKDNDSRGMFPANTPLINVISVAASNVGDAKPSWSNYGIKRVHVASPGEKIYSTLPGDKYGELSGTSMATPLVSGLVALMLSQNPKLTAEEVRALLQSTGTKVAIETACECRVDAFEAVNAVKTNALTAIPQAATILPTESIQFSAFGGKGPFKFASSEESIASFDESGKLTAKTLGEVQVTVTDSSGITNQTQKIRIAEAAAPTEPGGECPLEPAICDAMCQILPIFPWCQQ